MSEEKVYKEFMLYVVGRNVNKYRQFLHDEIERYEEKKTENSLKKGALQNIKTRGFCALKINTVEKRRQPCGDSRL